MFAGWFIVATAKCKRKQIQLLSRVFRTRKVGLSEVNRCVSQYKRAMDVGAATSVAKIAKVRAAIQIRCGILCVHFFTEMAN